MTPERGHQTAILNALAAGGCLTLDQLADSLELGRRQISSAAARLIDRALVVRIEAGCFRATAEGVDAQARGIEIKSGPRGPMERKRPARNSFRGRLWRGMRLKRKFSIPGLLELAAKGEKSPDTAAGSYIRALERAGYLTRLPRREPGTSLTSNGYLRWSLIRDTGPLPPMPRRDGTVFDPNTGEVMPCRG